MALTYSSLMRQTARKTAIFARGPMYLPLLLKYYHRESSQISTYTHEHYTFNMGKLYRKTEDFSNLLGARFDPTTENLLVDYAAEKDAKGNIEGEHMMVAGTTGSGKTTFLENLIFDICKRGNPHIIIIHSIKGGMKNDWRVFMKKAKEKEIPCKMVSFSPNSKEKLYASSFPLTTLKSLGMLTGAEWRELNNIFNLNNRSVPKTLMQIQKRFEDQKASQWMIRLMNALLTSNYFTNNTEEALVFEPGTVYIFDYSGIEQASERDTVIGTVYREVRSAVAAKQDFQAFHLLDEFGGMVEDSKFQKNLSDSDFYNEMQRTMREGRSQGVSQILAYQSKYGTNTSITKPLTQVQYAFQLAYQNENEKRFFLKNILRGRISDFELDAFFNFFEDTRGKAIFYNLKRPKEPNFVQLKPPSDMKKAGAIKKRAKAGNRNPQ